MSKTFVNSNFLTFNNSFFSQNKFQELFKEINDLSFYSYPPFLVLSVSRQRSLVWTSIYMDFGQQMFSLRRNAALVFAGLEGISFLGRGVLAKAPFIQPSPVNLTWELFHRTSAEGITYVTKFLWRQVCYHVNKTPVFRMKAQRYGGRLSHSDTCV